MKAKDGFLVLLLICSVHGFSGCCSRQQHIVVQNPNQSLKDKREEVEVLQAELPILIAELLRLQQRFVTNSPQQGGLQPGSKERKYSAEQERRDLDELIPILTEAKHKVAAERDRALRELKLPWYYGDIMPARSLVEENNE